MGTYKGAVPAVAEAFITGAFCRLRCERAGAPEAMAILAHDLRSGQFSKRGDLPGRGSCGCSGIAVLVPCAGCDEATRFFRKECHALRRSKLCALSVTFIWVQGVA